MSQVAKVNTVSPVRPNEMCEATCSAHAKIAFLVHLSNGREDRVVLCSHHFAALTGNLRNKIIAKHESK